MVIKALDHVDRCYSTADGAVIARVLRGAFARHQRVILSFAGVDDVPSSFVNASLVALMDGHTADWLKSKLSVIDATPQIADMIRRCIANASRLQAA
jgi:hypothetical protein